MEEGRSGGTRNAGSRGCTANAHLSLLHKLAGLARRRRRHCSRTRAHSSAVARPSQLPRAAQPVSPGPSAQ